MFDVLNKLCRRPGNFFVQPALKAFDGCVFALTFAQNLSTFLCTFKIGICPHSTFLIITFLCTIHVPLNPNHFDRSASEVYFRTVDISEWNSKKIEYQKMGKSSPRFFHKRAFSYWWSGARQHDVQVASRENKGIPSEDIYSCSKPVCQKNRGFQI